MLQNLAQLTVQANCPIMLGIEPFPPSVPGLILFDLILIPRGSSQMFSELKARHIVRFAQW